jgi:hypothetical protein
MRTLEEVTMENAALKLKLLQNAVEKAAILREMKKVQRPAKITPEEMDQFHRLVDWFVATTGSIPHELQDVPTRETLALAVIMQEARVAQIAKREGR